MNINITQEYNGLTVFDVLRKKLHLSCGTLTLLKNSTTGIMVNGERVTVRKKLQPGDMLSIDFSDKNEVVSDKIIPQKLPLKIIFEDEHIIIADKPAGMPTHPTHGHLDDTLANALAYRAEKKREPFVFRPANRLDRNTSGIVLSAKNRYVASRLFEMMKNGEIKKTYIALTNGVPDKESGIINSPIKRADEGILMRTVADDGAEAITEYRTLDVSNDGHLAFVVCEPHTGRTHQIRVHMAHISCPILGDFLYGKESDIISRHALHAVRLRFIHPITSQIICASSPLPNDFFNVYDKYFKNNN